MVAVIETKVYQYDELTDSAKAKARDWWMDATCDDFVSFHAYDVIANHTEALAEKGIILATYPVKLMNGKTRHDPDVEFDLDRRYCRIKANIDIEKFLTVHKLRSKFRRMLKHKGQFSFDYCNHNQRWNADDVYASENYFVLGQKLTDAWFNEQDALRREISRVCQEAERALLRDLLDEWEWVTSDEYVEDCIRANEYTFTEDGERFG